MNAHIILLEEQSQRASIKTTDFMCELAQGRSLGQQGTAFPTLNQTCRLVRNLGSTWTIQASGLGETHNLSSLEGNDTEP